MVLKFYFKFNVEEEEWFNYFKTLKTHKTFVFELYRNNEYYVWVDILRFALISLFDKCRLKVFYVKNRLLKISYISVLMKYECHSIVSTIDVFVGILSSNIMWVIFLENYTRMTLQYMYYRRKKYQKREFPNFFFQTIKYISNDWFVDGKSVQD